MLLMLPLAVHEGESPGEIKHSSQLSSPIRVRYLALPAMMCELSHGTREAHVSLVSRIFIGGRHGMATHVWDLSTQTFQRSSCYLWPKSPTTKLTVGIDYLV